MQQSFGADFLNEVQFRSQERIDREWENNCGYFFARCNTKGKSYITVLEQRMKITIKNFCSTLLNDFGF